MTENPLLYQVENNVARLTINREKQRNSLTPQVISLFMEYLDQARADEAVRAVLITGAGDKAFCSGADLGGAATEDGKSSFQNYADLLKRLAAYPKPTVARVNGASIGGSNGLVAACDIAIASHRAEFSLSEVKIGLVPACIGPYLLKKVGEGACRELFLSGERISADQACHRSDLRRRTSRKRLSNSPASSVWAACS